MDKQHSQLGFGLALILSLAAAPASARLAEALSGYDGVDRSAIPGRLSQTGLYDNVASPARKVTAGIIPFKVNSPLWSDGAHKQRWIQVPPGQKVAPTDTDHYDFPDQTVFVKNFAIEAVHGDSASAFLIETRFLVVRRTPGEFTPTTWGLSYRWDRDQGEAHLVNPDGGLDTLHRVRWGGRDAGKRWRYPSAGDCAACHQMRGVLGFITPQLHDGKQLKALADAGVLTRDPLAGRTNAFRWYAVDDKSSAATLERKSRSYFGANCSHCHGNESFPGHGCDQNFDYLTDKVDIRDSLRGYVDFRASGDPDTTSRLILPGVPEKSYVLKRMLARSSMIVDPATGAVYHAHNGEQMPLLATYQVDSSAMEVLRRWVCSLKPGGACKLPPAAPDSTFWDLEWPTGIVPRAYAARGGGPRAYVRGRNLVIAGPAPRGQAASAVPALFDFRGQRMPLVASGAGRYALHATVPRGAYYLKVGPETFVVNYLGE